jgi:hypothetical protein
MSLFPAYFGARKRANEDAAPAEPELENESRADVFNLIPPRASEKYERPEKTATPEKIETPGKAEGRNVHSVNAMDLTRLSIDNDGRLYWDGKPVEVRRQLMMSRGQAVGAGLVAFFIVIAAIGSAIQGAATLSDWACRSGWASNCTAPVSPAPKPPASVEIPA